ncbi:MAG: phosphoribosylglycinamide formyltransferase [Actinobacteria bacterium]|nr:phosphoribosylglycinamide formyltransferase [Actinomycetota bacterium]
MAARVVLLASGSGTLAQAIIDAEELEIEIVALISDNPDAQALTRAKEANIQTILLPITESRDEWNEEIIQTVASLSVDLVVSAGFMRVLPPDFVNRFPTINSHPALLPQFPGAHAVRDALAAGVSVTGTTVHWVDEGVDTGPIITQMEVPVLPGDDEATLHERIKKVEHGLIVATIALILPTLEHNV